MASTEQLVRLMKIIDKKYPRQTIALILWNDGSGSIRIAKGKGHKQGILTGVEGVEKRFSVCEWFGSNMGVKLWTYAKELVDELEPTPSGDPMEDMLQILEGEK